MTSKQELAKELIATIPPAMWWMRNEMRTMAEPELTVPQFRILANIFRGLTNVCQIARHHGVSQPAMSKMVEALVQRGLIIKTVGAEDRRVVKLSLSPHGLKLYETVKKQTQQKLEQSLKSLNSREKQDLAKGLQVLKQLAHSQLEVTK